MTLQIIDQDHIDTNSAIFLLTEHGLLERTENYRQHFFYHVEYNSKLVQSETLFFCKGLKFDPKYLTMAANQGASVAMAPAEYSAQLKTSEHPDLPQVIVTDIQKAMATVSRAFFGYPDRDLTVIGYTGTKGKTTSVYFTRHVMAKARGIVVAQLSSID